MLPCIIFSHAIVTKHVKHFVIFTHYNIHYFCLVYHLIERVDPCDLLRRISFVMFRAWWRIEVDVNFRFIEIPENFSPWVFELRTANCMFYLVSTMSIFFEDEVHG